ncbi:hypothetical protein [Geodermatophilus ruber]|uniref:Uncharacterized protein n=1 Tax=Geodermatophilus ruber TaxID=504800 RepID=A0A1I4L7E7_9ACTN|nr:hypothetical protein [Geodermatophilus ruber]SFL86841.1 hypothetical protein SAMN04488085_12057 [Geodermatophilus ruber]
MRARTSRGGLLLTVVAGCLLVLAGLVPTGSGSSPAGPAPVTSSASAPTRVTTGYTASGPRITGSRATLVPSGPVQFVERIGSLDDRTSAGPGDRLAAGPAVEDPWADAPPAPRPDRTAARPASTPYAALGARAPPAV